MTDEENKNNADNAAAENNQAIPEETTPAPAGDILDLGVGDEHAIITTGMTGQAKVIDMEVVEKPSGEIVSFTCEIEGIEKPQKFNGVKYLHPKSKKLTSSGLWITKDPDGKLSFYSGLSIMLQKFGVKNLREMKGNSYPFSTDDNGYPVFKAY